MSLKTDIKKIQNILNADYEHENPDVIRNKKFGHAFATMLKHLFPECKITRQSIGLRSPMSLFLSFLSIGAGVRP